MLLGYLLAGWDLLLVAARSSCATYNIKASYNIYGMIITVRGTARYRAVYRSWAGMATKLSYKGARTVRLRGS